MRSRTAAVNGIGILGLAPLVLGGACAGQRSTAPGRPPRAAESTTAAALKKEGTISPTAPGASRGDLVLLEAGSTPRQLLAHRFAVGLAETVVVESGGTLSLAVGEMSPPAVHTPPLRFTLSLEVRAAAGETATLAGTVAKVEALPAPDVPAAMVAAVRSDAAALAGSAFTAVAHEDGRIDNVSLLAPGGANPQVAHPRQRLRRAIEGLLPAVPDEPVGRGARWEVRRPATVGAARVDEIAHYTVTELGPGRARLAVKLTQTAMEQQLSLPGLPAGATVTLSSVVTSGSGRIDLSPGKLGHPAELRFSTLAAGSADTADGVAPVKMQATGYETVRRGKP